MTKATGTETKKTAAKTTETKVVKMVDLKPIKLTQDEFGKLDAAALRAKLCSEPQPRISRERGHSFLVERVENGKINSITAVVLMNWTYRGVVVEGIAIEGQGRSVENAVTKLSQKEFDELTPAGKAALIKELTHKRRAADVIIPDLVSKGLPLTAEDVVYLTNGRIEIEGVTIAKSNKVAHALTDGVTFE